MALLEWKGSEVRVFDPTRPTYWLVVTGLAIDTYEADHESSRAFGTLEIYDYQSKQSFRMGWQATRACPTWENRWFVFFEAREGLTEAFNRGIAWSGDLMEGVGRALDRLLSDFAALGRIDIDQATPFDGTCPEGIGPCVCSFLQGHHAYNQDEPVFSWYDFTKGKAPRRCFLCGCGRRWWQFDPDIDEWREVADVEAWDMLVAHNGEPFNSVWFDREGRINLVSTMIRDNIPMVEGPEDPEGDHEEKR